jgi:ubiquinone/menaquinone biosynthesis C-methylase UbiE
MKKNNFFPYLHGFDPKEQQRLIHQAEFLEPYVYNGIHFEDCKNLLEVGCGVGAQTKILTRRFPKIKVTSLDFSPQQLSVAAKYLSPEIKSKQVNLQQQDALKMKLKETNFDSAFLCWFLEHVPDPLLALKNVRKHLKTGSRIYCSEVFNQTLFMDPYSPSYMKYWFEFNDYQWTIKGHPFIGAQLGNLLTMAGFKNVKTEVIPFHFDSRNPKKRDEFVEYFFNILLSAQEPLLQTGRVSKELISEMKKEVKAVIKAKDAVFFYAFIRASAEA